MDRRRFLSYSLTSGILAGAVPKLFAAKSKTPLESELAGGVFYTKENPGRWSKKSGSHLPQIAVTVKNGKNIVKVITAHPVNGFKHYIVKHILLDKDFKFIAEKMFDPEKDKTPQSSFELENYKGKIYVLSVCNKHDTWENFTEI